MNIEVIRKDWVGRTVHEKYQLLEWLGSFGQSGVFVCQVDGNPARRAAIKLFPAEIQGSAACSAGWATAAGLAHPHLVRVLDTGRDQVENTGVLFVVTEYAGEILSEILPERALTPAEVTEMLGPILDALAYLHDNGLVHGRLKPSNIMVVDEQLKLSSENIRGSAARITPPSMLEIYDAPEKAQGKISPPTDMWSLGVTLVEALTRVPPAWNRAGTLDPIVPHDLAEPFAQITRECLRLDPENRCTISEIHACLETGAAIPHRPIKAVKPRAMTKPIAEPERETVKEQATRPASKPRVFVIVAAAAVLLAAFAIVMLHSHHGTPGAASEQTTTPAAENPGQPSSQAPTQAPAPQEAAHSQSAAAAPQSQAQPVQSAPAATPEAQTLPVPAPQTASAAPAPERSAPASQIPSGPAARAAVAQQVMPDIPEKASRTIHGTVKTTIQVSVDASGSVSNASIDSQGPSRYFANLALEAARSWKFTPARVNGQGAPSVWVLHFAFRQSGTEVTPTEQMP